MGTLYRRQRSFTMQRGSQYSLDKFALVSCEGSMYWALLRSHYGYFYHQYWSNITILFYYFIISIDHGRNNFGQDGTLTCNASNPDVGCQGTLFCLPDPYGCSCAAGFIGTNCKSGMSSSNYRLIPITLFEPSHPP